MATENTPTYNNFSPIDENMEQKSFEKDLEKDVYMAEKLQAEQPESSLKLSQRYED